MYTHICIYTKHGVHEALERRQRQIGRFPQEDADGHAVKPCRAIYLKVSILNFPIVKFTI